MLKGTSLTGLALLLALSVRPAPDPAPQTGGGSPPRITSATFETRELAGPLAREAAALGTRKGAPVWAGYAIPEVAARGNRRICCWDSTDTLEASNGCCGRCSLDGNRGFNVSTDGDTKVRLESGGYLHVLFRSGSHGVTRIRTFSRDCELDAGNRPFVWLTGVPSDESLDWLASLVEEGSGSRGRNDDEDRDDNLSKEAVQVIAMHAGPRADRLLERYASSGHREDIREQAIFWMGQVRGRAGYDIVSRIAREDPRTDIRKKAIFSVSQSEVPEGVDLLIRLAHDDPRSEIRMEALFWLAQKAGERAASALSYAVEKDPELEVKKKAVFALTQLPNDEGVPMLLDLARKHRLPEIRKEAIFWLGQSGDPRALDLIEEILR